MLMSLFFTLYSKAKAKKLISRFQKRLAAEKSRPVFGPGSTSRDRTKDIDKNISDTYELLSRAMTWGHSLDWILHEKQLWLDMDRFWPPGQRTSRLSRRVDISICFEIYQYLRIITEVGIGSLTLLAVQDGCPHPLANWRKGSRKNT
jgi:hypothetical protein